MLNIFQSDNAVSLLRNKFIIIIGDSVQRGIYKDIVYFLQRNELMPEECLKRKGEKRHFRDQLIEGGTLGELTNKKSYTEVRQFTTLYHLVRFYFVTRCYSVYMETIFSDIQKDEYQPDVIIMNSCLWDISRYGSKSLDTYQKNLQITIQRFKEVLPARALFIWNTTLPVGKHIKGGFLIPQIEQCVEFLRLDVATANFFAAQVVTDYEYDVLDLNHLFRNEYAVQHRIDDGVHWNSVAHRHMTNFLLEHISYAWDVPMPPVSRHGGQQMLQHRRAGGRHERSYSDNLITYTVTGNQPRPGPLPNPYVNTNNMNANNNRINNTNNNNMDYGPFVDVDMRAFGNTFINNPHFNNYQPYEQQPYEQHYEQQNDRHYEQQNDQHYEQQDDQLYEQQDDQLYDQQDDQLYDQQDEHQNDQQQYDQMDEHQNDHLYDQLVNQLYDQYYDQPREHQFDQFKMQPGLGRNHGRHNSYGCMNPNNYHF